MDLETPLSGGDRIKVIIFFLLMAGTIFFGIVPILIAISSIYIMKKDKSFSSVLKSKKYIKVYLYVLALVIPFFLATLAKYNKIYIAEYNQIYIAVGMAFIGLIFMPLAVSLFMKLFNYLYFTPLEEHKIWVVKNGIFSDSTGIMGRDKLNSFSVADELLKWNDMLEKNLISQEEFNKAKQKILNQK